MIYDGLRFRVQAMLAGKVYAGAFGLDVGFGDVLTEPPEIVDGKDFLAFAGVLRARHRIYPRVVHIAEKLHAYTLPRPRENSRVKDLPDLALLAQIGSLDPSALRKIAPTNRSSARLFSSTSGVVLAEASVLSGTRGRSRRSRCPVQFRPS